MQAHIKKNGLQIKKSSTLSLSQCYDEAIKELGLAESYQQYLQKPEAVNPIFLMQILATPGHEVSRYQFDGTWRSVSYDEPYASGDYFTTDERVYCQLKSDVMKCF